MTSVILLAGGLGKRLGKLTQKIPKPLIKIKNIPFINYQLDYLKKQGFTNIVICTGYLHEMFYDEVGDGKSYGLNINYSVDYPKLLGTGGAIKKALPLVSNNFFIMYADSYLTINFSDVLNNYINQKKDILMTIFKNNNKLDKSNIELKNNQVIYNKNQPNQNMNYIDYGLSIANKKVFEYVNKNEFDYSELLSTESKKKNISGYKAKNRFYEIGSPNGLSEFRELVNEKKVLFNLY